MREELLKAIALREERVALGGITLVVREMSNAVDVSSLAEGEDLGWKYLVRCVFDENGEPAFTDDDVPAIKAGSKEKFTPLIKAVNRVNGWDVEAEAKNSAAAQD